MALKVFDLACENAHVFEGWFRSHEDYDQQVERGLLSCPLCNSQRIEKKLSAPRLNLKHGRSRSASATESTESSAQTASASASAPTETDATNLVALQAEVLKQIRQVIKNTDDVGDQFASEARKMHEGEVPERAIRGSATAEEYQELREEGIAVLPIPEFMDDDRLN